MRIVSYELNREDGSECRFEVDIERPERMVEQNSEDHPDWTRLSCNQCPNCPFSSEEFLYCPAAIEIEQIARQFADTSSIERTDVWVHTEERSFFKNVDMQNALKSLFGLIMASGSCTILARLKPLAHFHLPFATLQETIHRLVDTYLINLRLMKRIRIASSEDASINATQTFISIASIVKMGEGRGSRRKDGANPAQGAVKPLSPIPEPHRHIHLDMYQG